MNIKITTKEWLFLPKGERLRLTGRVNGIPASECVRVGYFDECKNSPYQHAPDGQIIWIRNDILEEITNETLV